MTTTRTVSSLATALAVALTAAFLIARVWQFALTAALALTAGLGQ